MNGLRPSERLMQRASRWAAGGRGPLRQGVVFGRAPWPLTCRGRCRCLDAGSDLKLE